MKIKNILVVDDEQNILNAISRQLRPYRDQWNLFFALSGKQALELMATQPIDLIISDMLMPEMLGDELLNKVMLLYPATVRIALSGYADEETLKNGMAAAHQYLSKPCTAEVLREVISQVFKIQACISNPQIIASFGDSRKLPSLPRVYLELNNIMANDGLNTQDVAKILASDMVISAKLLHFINSPYFGVNRIISNLAEAINILGLKKLHSLVLSVHLKNSFVVIEPELEQYMEYLWLDAARTSELAMLISQAENQTDDRPDQAFLGGVLHNLGLLMFMSNGGDKLKSLLEKVKTTTLPIEDIETSIYGFTRFEAAAYLLSLWKIPPRIIESVLLQNKPNETEYNGMNALTAVHAAACLLKPSVMTEYEQLFAMELDTEYLQRINKLDRLTEWQKLAELVLARNANNLA
jgi:HD-like signal output (HDOD) protein/ActR/RegA family two-component response regulator